MEQMSTFLWGSLVAIIVCILAKLLDRNRKWWTSRGVINLEFPGLYSRTFQKVSLLQTDKSLYTQSAISGFGGYMELFKPTFLVRDLDLVKNICVKDFDYFVNRQKFPFNDHLLDDMLVAKCDNDWKHLRAAMTPTFTTGKIRRMFPIMNESSKKLVKYLQNLAGKNDGTIELEDALGRYAMDVISSAAFAIESQIFEKEDAIVSKMANKLQFKPNVLLLLKLALANTSETVAKIFNVNFIEKEAGDFFTKVIMDKIKHRETTGEKRNDFLQLMIDAKNGKLTADGKNDEEIDSYEKDSQLAQKELGKKSASMSIDDQLFVANCILFIFGGFDTTQSLLTFGAYALALNQKVQQNLRKELQELTKNTGGELTYDLIHKAEYLDKVVNEMLRMYPPVLRNERRCTKDYILPNKSILPKETLVLIPVYQIHHDEEHFPNPELFDPQRFSPEAKAKRHSYAFMPFGLGPRNCIAMRFALTETKVAVANLVLNFDIETCAKTTIPMVYLDSPDLKPKDAMWLKINARVN